MERKIITVIGSNVGQDEIAERFTATCECGCTMVRAKKESSLSYYIDNPKYTAKHCCGSMLHETGIKTFKGEEIIEATAEQVVETPVVETPVEEVKVDETPVVETSVEIPTTETTEVIVAEVTPINGPLTPGKRGITNQQMIPALQANYKDMEKMRELYKAYPEVFKSSVKYLNDKIKLAANLVILENEPTFEFTMGERAKAKLAAAKSPKVELQPAI